MDIHRVQIVDDNATTVMSRDLVPTVVHDRVTTAMAGCLVALRLNKGPGRMLPTCAFPFDWNNPWRFKYGPTSDLFSILVCLRGDPIAFLSIKVALRHKIAGKGYIVHIVYI